MKTITMFYQPRCPFCKKALAYIEALKSKNAEYAALDIKFIDELQEAELADKYDYYYVPTFYIGQEKVHEGGIYEPEVEEIFKRALKSGSEIAIK